MVRKRARQSSSYLPYILAGVGVVVLVFAIIGVILAIRFGPFESREQAPIQAASEEQGLQPHDTQTLKDPKWLKGPAVAQALIGRWRRPGLPREAEDGYDFNPDGTYLARSPLFKTPGTYKLVADNRYLELTFRPTAPGTPPQMQTVRFRALVNDKELVIGNVYPDGKIGFGTPMRRVAK